MKNFGKIFGIAVFVMAICFAFAACSKDSAPQPAAQQAPVQQAVQQAPAAQPAPKIASKAAAQIAQYSRSTPPGMAGYEIFDSYGDTRMDTFLSNFDDETMEFWVDLIAPNLSFSLVDANNNSGFYIGIVGGYCTTSGMTQVQKSGSTGPVVLIQVFSEDYNWSYFYFTSLAERDNMPDTAFLVD